MPFSSLQLAHGLALTNSGNVDPYYDGGTGLGYASTTDACAGVPSAVRQGKTVAVVVSGAIVEYWWPTTAVADTDLVVKTPDLSGKQNTSEKNAANGYAGLDGSGKVAAAQLPSYVDDVLEVANFAALPGTGETGKIYVTLDTNFEYRWSGSTYIRLVASPGTTDALAEGSTNLYFTAARVLAVLLTGLSTATNAAIATTDSILSALGKLQAQITAALSSIATNTTNITTNATAISTEVTNRTNADTTLQTNIDAKSDKIVTFNDQTGTDYTLVLTDAGKKIRTNNAAANTVTIPLNASVAFAIGTRISIRNIGAGITSIAGISGVTTHGPTDLTQYQEAFLTKETTDLWGITLQMADVTALAGPYANIKRVGNSVIYTNRVYQQGGSGNSVNYGGGKSFTANDANMPTGVNPDLTMSVWLKQTYANISASTYGVFRFGSTGSAGFSIFFYNGTTIYLYNGTGAATGGSLSASTALQSLFNGQWNLFTVKYTGGVATFYVNGVSIGTITQSTNITLGGSAALTNVSGGITAFFGGSSFAANYSEDQRVVWNTALTLTQIQAIYNSGGGTSSLPAASSIVFRLEYEDGTGTSASDSNPGTQYAATLSASGLWGGSGSGIVPSAGTYVTSTYMQSIDGINANERGQFINGDANSGTRTLGYTIKELINGYLVRIVSQAGKVLINPTNTNENATAASTHDVAGNETIGAGYAGVNAAPANGEIIQGRLLVGTATDNVTDQVQIAGNMNLVNAGNKIKIATGTNASVGTATLVAGTVTVNTTAVATGSIIILTRKTAGGTVGALSLGTIVNNTSFVISSDNASDTSTVNWLIIN